MIYNFTVEMKNTGKGYVEADSIEEAKKKILEDHYEDIYDTCDEKIVSVISIEADNDCEE